MYKQLHPSPVVGNWYEAGGMPASFTVVDFERGDYIDIQYLDGQLDQIDIEAWEAMHAKEIPAPEDPSAPFGEVENDDDISTLLNELQDQDDLEERLHNIDHDEDSWM